MPTPLGYHSPAPLHPPRLASAERVGAPQDAEPLEPDRQDQRLEECPDADEADVVRGEAGHVGRVTVHDSG